MGGAWAEPGTFRGSVNKHHSQSCGRRTPQTDLCMYACDPFSVVGQHTKSIEVIDCVELPRACAHARAQTKLKCDAFCMCPLRSLGQHAKLIECYKVWWVPHLTRPSSSRAKPRTRQSLDSSYLLAGLHSFFSRRRLHILNRYGCNHPHNLPPGTTSHAPHLGQSRALNPVAYPALAPPPSPIPSSPASSPLLFFYLRAKCPACFFSVR